MLHFCTYFDSNYLHRGLVLYRSLERQGEAFVLWILCFDDTSYDALAALRLRHARLIRRADFEAGDEALAQARRDRRFFEYYWTCTPTLLLRVLELDPAIDVLTYVDADIAFFGPPSAIVAELGQGDILLNPQRVSPEYGASAASGVFNVGVNAFRRGPTSLAALEWWREQCLNECRYAPEEGRYGDQHYLNDWPRRFDGVVVSRHLGLGVAPWNLGSCGLTQDGTGFRVREFPLICFHFHALQLCTRSLAFVAHWRTPVTRSILDGLFRPYVRELYRAEREIREAGHAVRLPCAGVPWLYIVARIAKRQPMKHFVWLSREATAT